MRQIVPFDQKLRERVRANLAEFHIKRLSHKGHKHAAVAFTLTNQVIAAGIGNIPFERNCRDQAAFILTIRATRLSSHAGQRAYPGGRVDPGEDTVEAALRELQEEVGLSLRRDSVLGLLDDYATRSGYIISPVVIWGGQDAILIPNPDEVAQIHRVPVAELLRDDAPILEFIPESDHPILKMPLGDEWIAAPSAAICYQFREVALLGRSTRVAHFEQPRFAWT